MNPVNWIKATLNFIRQIYLSKHILYELTMRDFKQKYVTNIMGLAWAVLDPIAMMLIFWFVFGIGMRAGEQMGVPFVTYLITGLSAFMFFTQTLTVGTASIKAYSFLLKKVDFMISIVPLVKIFSEIILHLIVLCIAMIIIMANGIYPSLYWLQVIYFIFAASMLLLSLSWLTASISLFFPDITYIINIILRLLFYMTPIFWSETMFSSKVIFILKLNPIYYLVQGYRQSLLYEQPIWMCWRYALYFWSITFFCFIVGITVFRKLRPHFADVV
ncbi:MAG: ABC transporter permease [Desulfobacteraceae bacterium]|jgi:ABC-type polysaccharide/polyol phosphate export permease|nr:ABC transporter permease [Desulfobacteraceae bacterium]